MVWVRAQGYHDEYDNYYMNNPDSYDEDDNDDYDSEGDDYGYGDGHGSSMTGSGNADETSTVRSARRFTRSGRMPRDSAYEACNATFTDEHFTTILNRFRIVELKAILDKINQPKSGNKLTLVRRTSLILYRLFNTDTKAYNILIEFIDTLRGDVRRFPMFIKDFEKGYEDSLKYKFDFDLPPGYKIEKVLGNPIYLPAFPQGSVRKYFRASFKYEHCNGSSANARVMAVVLRIKNIKENPEPGSVDFRISRGSWIRQLSINGHYVGPSPADRPYICEFPAYALRNGPNVFSFSMTKMTNYYVQLMEISVDRKSRPVIPAEEVKRIFLKNQADSGVESMSIQLSLRCPITMIRMQAPIRFGHCKHLQCIDLASWPGHDTDFPHQTCPLCSQKTTIAFIDGFTKEILEATTPDVDNVVIDVDNGLSWKVPSSLAGSSLSASVDEINVETKGGVVEEQQEEEVWIDLYDDATVYDAPWLPPAPVKATNPPKTPVKTGSSEALVDLTSDMTPRRQITPAGFMPASRVARNLLPEKRTGATFEDAIILD